MHSCFFIILNYTNCGMNQILFLVNQILNKTTVSNSYDY